MRPLEAFSNPTMVANYAESTPRKVPGLADMQRMAMLLLAEQAPAPANILVLGAGGGLELKLFAEAQPHWQLLGIDPSAAMLDLASRTLGPLQQQVTLQQGYIDTAPPGPFDGATCLLTLHFLAPDERLHTMRQIHQRLRPGAKLVVAHHSCPPGGDLTLWLSRSVAFANDAAVAAAPAVAAMAGRLPILSATEDEALIRKAGFSDVALFYAAFSFRGWVATA